MRQASIVSASQRSISAKSVQRRNGQRFATQMGTSARLAKITSAWPAAYRSDSPSPMNTTARPAARWASTRARLQVPQMKHVGCPFGKSIRAPPSTKTVRFVTTGTSPRPSDANAGPM